MLDTKPKNTNAIISTAAWTTALIEAGRVTPMDVARIRSEIFPLGLSSRHDGEAVFAVEREILDSCPAWHKLFRELIVDLVVWGERPTGIVTDEQANWLVRQIDRTTTITTLRTLKAVLDEASTTPHWFGNAVGARSGLRNAGPAGSLRLIRQAA